MEEKVLVVGRADTYASVGGMHDHDCHMIPLVPRSALTQKPIRILSADYLTPDGTSLRDYVHVTDFVKAILNVRAYVWRFKYGIQARQQRGVTCSQGDRFGHLIDRQEYSGNRRWPKAWRSCRLAADAQKTKQSVGWCTMEERLEAII